MEEEKAKDTPKDDSSDQDQSSETAIRRRRRDDKGQRKLGPSPTSNDKDIVASKLKRKKKKDENLACSKFITFLMISPTIIYFFSVLYDIISKYTVSGKFLHISALILGFIIAGILCAVLYKPIKPFIKYLGFASLCVFFIPTIQVFNCSPLPLDNSKLGTLVRLNENVDKFVKIAYQNSSCWRSQFFKTPYELSVYSPRLKIFLKPYQVINLGMQHFDQKEDTFDGPPPELLPYTLYLLTSQRSVKRQMYYLNLLAMVAGKARGIADVLELSVDDRENVTLQLTGSLNAMGGEFNETKAELEAMQYLVRPLIFHVHEIEVLGMPEKEEEDDDGGKKKKQKNRSYKKSKESDEDDRDEDNY